VRHFRQFTPWICAVATAAAFCVGARAQQSRPGEYQIEAAYLFNFLKFVEWPEQAALAKDDPFAICVIGQDPFGRTLDSTLAGELIDERKVIARRISKPEDAPGCQILFISSSEDARLKDILPRIGRAAALTVSDIPHFSERGGMIQFVMEKDKIRFEVNLTNAQHAGLSLSSELLKVALAVKKDAQPGD
jgi:hypothetical protein